MKGEREQNSPVDSMALQDLTPQLRTRLSRMERAVGWFVLLAAGLLVFGFVYYVYNTAERKGWFKIKAPYFTFTDRATGLKEGDPVQMMGLDVGQITDIKPMAPDQFEYNMYIEFEIKEPYYGYLWTEGSRAKVVTADLLGKRTLEVTKGAGGHPTYVFQPLKEIQFSEAQTLPELEKWKLGEDIYDATGTNLITPALSGLSTNLDRIAALGIKQIRVLDDRERERKKTITAIWQDKQGHYEAYTKEHKPYWLQSDESAAVTERLERLVDDVEKALPNILGLTNQLASVLSNSTSLTSNLNVVAANAQPVVSNLTAATAHLDRPGALGEWLFSTNVNRQLETTLGSANGALENANTNLTALAEKLGSSLESLASMTSNLNSQVQSNSNIVSQVSRVIVNTDDLVQGLKKHWLLRSAFKTKATNAPSLKKVEPIPSPKEKP
jgi:ABC-type transporter Mla subunit MlaD